MQVTSNIFICFIFFSLLFCFNANAAVNSIDDFKYIDPVFTQDDRKIKSYSSPSYLDAIGKLIITFQDNSNNRCTANLTDTEINRSSKILTSAEHCQRILLGIASSVVGQGADMKIFFLSGGVNGSSETYISSYEHFLQPRYVNYFNLNK